MSLYPASIDKLHTYMKYLIVGLGNIGREYEATRHNIGFRIADALAARLGTSFATKRYGDVATGRIKNAQVVLLKPSTYMNLSGEAVRYWMSTERITIDHILVLVDDLALPFGTLRLKGKGSDAGHNGLKNIAQLLGSQAYPRLRFGIGNDYPQGKQIDYVLGSFHSEEEARLPQLIEYACEATVAFCLEGITSAMNKYNSAAPTDL
jgi:aminoacyl-tRNA hydrolase